MRVSVEVRRLQQELESDNVTTWTSAVLDATSGSHVLHLMLDTSGYPHLHAFLHPDNPPPTSVTAPCYSCVPTFTPMSLLSAFTHPRISVRDTPCVTVPTAPMLVLNISIHPHCNKEFSTSLLHLTLNPGHAHRPTPGTQSLLSSLVALPPTDTYTHMAPAHRSPHHSYLKFQSQQNCDGTTL